MVGSWPFSSPYCDRNSGHAWQFEIVPGLNVPAVGSECHGRSPWNVRSSSVVAVVSFGEDPGRLARAPFSRFRVPSRPVVLQEVPSKRAP